jgi:drug/metabolite transporter (DMT)-like permease
VLAIALGLGAALSWGVGDFLGGLKARALPVLTVIFVSQAAGLVLIAAIIAIRGESPPGGSFALYAALSAICGLLALTAFYRGLAVGAMGVVAPISATAAVIPFTVGVATGERPSALQVAGAAVCLAGVMLASREKPDGTGRGARMATGAGLALLAAVGFGGFFLSLDKASEDDVLWAIFANRVTGVVVVAAVVAIARPKLRLSGGDARVLALIGVLDITANTLFAAASTQGLVSIVSVLSSLYPITVVVLAFAVLGERLQRLQLVGALGALAGAALISAG